MKFCPYLHQGVILLPPPFPVPPSSPHFTSSSPFVISPSQWGPLNHVGHLGERCKLLSGVRGRALAKNEFGALKSCERTTGGNHLEYSEVHVLQQNDQNLTPANIAKSANDNMMTRHQLRGFLASPHSACVLSWSWGRSPQWGAGAKTRLGVWTGGRSPQKRKHSY